MTRLPSHYGSVKAETSSPETDQVSRMITMVSHELKNPLSAIQLTAEMLSTYRAHFSEADQEKHLQHLLNNTKLLKELIDKTSIYYRLLLQVIQPDPQEVDLHELIRNLVIEASEWPDCKQHFDLQPKKDSHRLVLDAFQMKVVFEYVFKNAMHFSEPDSTIGIHCSIQDDMLEINISDTGTNIPENHLEQVFEPFFRTRDFYGNTGTGLGLAICRLIVSMHQGKMRVSNNPTKGVTVHICLPMT
jgi:signal transduction histidine kinase